LCLLLLLFLPDCASVPQEARVIQVIDGDTIVVAGGYHVRYIGIDTPEKGQPFYEEAKQYNRELVEGETVRLEKDVTDKDKFKRLLRYVYVDSVFVNAELVRQGYADVYPEDRFPDNRYYNLLEEALREAQAEGRGIWEG
jgi:micrococcal nuclease